MAEIRDKLEILAGLPCQLYQISPPGGPPFGEAARVTFGRDLRNGAILKTQLIPRFQVLFNTINDTVEDADVLYNTIIGNDVQRKDGDSKDGGVDRKSKRSSKVMDDLSNAERSFLMLYLSSHYGLHRICKIILRFGKNNLNREGCSFASNNMSGEILSLLHIA